MDLPDELNSTNSPSKPTLGKRSRLRGIHNQPSLDVKRVRIETSPSISSIKPSIDSSGKVN